MESSQSSSIEKQNIDSDNLEYDDTQEPFWKAIVEIGKKVPPEEWDKLPKDFARNFEHYMYGAPREEDYDNE